jgi:hypothetical protein
VATLHEFARHSSHKADDDFPALLWASKARIRVIYEFRQWYKLDGGTMVKESYYAMKGGSRQIRREGDDANVFSRWEGSRVFRSGHSTRLIQNYGKYRCVHRV